MYVSVTRTRGPVGQPLDVATTTGEEMLPWLRQIDGFEGLLMLSNQEESTTLVLSFWESRETADRHRHARMEFRDRITATVDVEVEETVGYELAFAQVGPRLAAQQV